MTALDGLQEALAAEHAAVFVYGALGAHTSASATPGLYGEILETYVAHRDRRDELVERVRSHDGEPVASAALYELPKSLGTPAAVTRAALDLEERSAATYAWLVEQTTGEDRAFAVSALTETAVRALAYRGSPEILPGTTSTRTGHR